MNGPVSEVIESEQIVLQLLVFNFVNKTHEIGRGVVNKVAVET